MCKPNTRVVRCLVSLPKSPNYRENQSELNQPLVWGLLLLGKLGIKLYPYEMNLMVRFLAILKIYVLSHRSEISPLIYQPQEILGHRLGVLLTPHAKLKGETQRGILVKSGRLLASSWRHFSLHKAISCYKMWLGQQKTGLSLYCH